MTPLRALGGLAALALGCSSTPPAVVRPPEPEYVRATPIIEHGPPVAVAATGRAAPEADGEDEPTAESGVSGPLAHGEPMPSSPAPTGPRSRETRRASSRSAAEVIAEANAIASQAPEASGFLNAVMTYTYVPGAIFKVITAPNNVTDLVLEPGEELMGSPVAGDTVRWKVGVGPSAVNGVPQQHVFVKPTRPGLATNLTLNTNRRTYFVKLESVEGEFMVAVQWNYPQVHSPAAVGARPAPTAASEAMAAPVDVTALNFGYTIEVVQGRPAWKPLAVYDNGQKTFIRFDPSIVHGESPVLYVLARDDFQLVNYRVKGDLYVVDRLFEVAELRLGQDDQDVIRLSKSKRRK